MIMDLLQVIEQVGREKGIEKEVLIDAVEAALLSASRKALGTALDLQVDFDERSGRFKLYAVKRVVERPTNPKLEVSLEEALKLNPKAKLQDEVKIELPAQGFGRIAAQTAKQVIIQRVREAEREGIYQSFKNKEGELVSGVVHRVVKGNVIVNLGKAEAILPPREQLPREDYRVGDRIRAYVLDVKKTPKGSQIILSRTHPAFLVKLFEVEVPEILEGIVAIRAAAREPGERAKIAVQSIDQNVDPVGACVGYRGQRVQAVVRELGGEKIDILPWRDDPVTFVKSALAPAEVESVVADQEAHVLRVVVADDQLSLAIGKRGVNARLAAKLLGWRVDIKSRSELREEALRRAPVPEVALGDLLEEPRGGGDVLPPSPKAVGEGTLALQDLPGIGQKLAARLVAAGFISVEKLASASREDLLQVEGIGEKMAEKLLAAAKTALSGKAPQVV
ncbi:MAG: transcription termination/antitermination protein NusA [candidate division NC10 bacterium]|nr:transcription termination/antitermination protein NusA [candidate division NC10 bacterium]